MISRNDRLASDNDGFLEKQYDDLTVDLLAVVDVVAVEFVI